MAGPIFASGAVLNADGTITPVVDAKSPRFTAETTPSAPTVSPPPAEPAAGDDDDIPVPVEPTEPGGGEGAEPEEPAEPAVPPAPTPQDLGQHPGESNRRFRARLWEENQNYQRRHTELLARDTEREQRLAFLEGQLAVLQRASVEPQGQPQGQGPAVPPGMRPRPQPQQYGDYQQYEDDLLNWRDEVRAAETAAHQRAQAASQVEQVWRQRTEEGRLQYPDYDRRMAQLQVATGPGSVLAPFFVGSEHGAALMYHLGTHAEELRAFNAMTPDAAARYLVGLEARLAREQGHSRDRSGRVGASVALAPPAPAPLAPVGTGSAQPVLGFHAGMPLSDYEQMRLKERNGRP